MMETSVLYEVAGPVATLTMNRAAKRNALDGALVAALGARLADAAADPAVRVVVLTGAGRVFSAGADLAALEGLQAATAMENLADSERLAVLFRSIYLHPKPVIAMVNGHAIAGGCGLAAVCDLSVASDRARLGFSEVRIGFVPAIVMVFVLRKIGEAAARDLLLRGRLVPGEEAVRAGLINRVVPSDRLEETVQALAGELASETSASAVALTKRMLADVPGMGLEEALGYAARINAFARGTADCRDGVRAFLQKTTPPWRNP